MPGQSGRLEPRSAAEPQRGCGSVRDPRAVSPVSGRQRGPDWRRQDRRGTSVSSCRESGPRGLRPRAVSPGRGDRLGFAKPRPVDLRSPAVDPETDPLKDRCEDRWPDHVRPKSRPARGASSWLEAKTILSAVLCLTEYLWNMYLERREATRRIGLWKGVTGVKAKKNVTRPTIVL